MTRLRHASFLLVVLAVLLATGTGAFTTVGAERPFEVSVADEENALLGIERPFPDDRIKLNNGVNNEQEGSSGGKDQFDRVEILTITNRYSEDIDITVTPSEGSTRGSPPKFAGEHALDVEQHGDEFDVTADIVCSNADAEDELTVSIEAHSDDGAFSVRTTETITVTCTGQGSGGDGSTEETTETTAD